MLQFNVNVKSKLRVKKFCLFFTSTFFTKMFWILKLKSPINPPRYLRAPPGSADAASTNCSSRKFTTIGFYYCCRRSAAKTPSYFSFFSFYSFFHWPHKSVRLHCRSCLVSALHTLQVTQQSRLFFCPFLFFFFKVFSFFFLTSVCTRFSESFLSWHSRQQQEFPEPRGHIWRDRNGPIGLRSWRSGAGGQA